MELARITSKGQITIPAEIRKRLHLKDGDKVVFLEHQGMIVIENSAMLALRDFQSAFEGEAERLGIRDEEDVVAMVKEVRRQRAEAKDADHG